MQKTVLTFFTLLASGMAVACGFDNSLADYPRLTGESDDTARIGRAVAATPSGVLYFPPGVYQVSRMIKVNNLCSLALHKNAILRAVRPMEYVLHVDNGGKFWTLPKDDDRFLDYNMFVKGGRIDGNGLAGCMALDGFCHYTLRDMSFLNGRGCGLRVNGVCGGYELIAENLYFKCTLPGLAGNAAVYTTGGDSHYTDCISVDYTVGFRIARGGGSNNFTRCHVWGGKIPPGSQGEPPEMLKDSVAFWIDGGQDALLRDCYADTSETGFRIDGEGVRLFGCRFYNSPKLKLPGSAVIDHRRGRLLVSGCRFNPQTKGTVIYKGVGTVEWRDTMLAGVGSNTTKYGNLAFGAVPQKEKQ